MLSIYSLDYKTKLECIFLLPNVYWQKCKKSCFYIVNACKIRMKQWTYEARYILLIYMQLHVMVWITKYYTQGRS